MNWFWQLIQRLYLDKFGNIPSPPEKLGEISGRELNSLLREMFPVGHIAPCDAQYDLTSTAEVQRFLNWNPAQYARYTSDDWDCDKFAWATRYFALKWSDGKYPFGWIWGFDEPRKIASHAWLVFPDYQRKLHYVGSTGHLAGKREIIPAFPISYLEDLII